MNKAVRTVCTSLALIFFGVQLCQYGLISVPGPGDYESLRFEQSSLPRAEAATKAVNAHVSGELKSETAIDTHKKEITLLLLYDNTKCIGPPTELIKANHEHPVVSIPSEFPMSAQIHGAGMAEIFIRERRQYQGVLMESDECYRIPTDIRETKHIQLVFHSRSLQPMARRQIPESLQRQFSTAKDPSQPHTKIVFSAQSSHYFGYQVVANAHAFGKSNQTNASWIRLLTSQRPDDLSDRFPTFAAPRSLHSREYVPINKADVILKWFLSADRPHPEDTIVVLDPDSWLLKDLDPWTRRVSRGHAVGQAAYYEGSKLCQNLWRLICLGNCDRNMDLVGVPYLVKASDLALIAPLWKKYSLIIRSKIKQETFQKRFGHLGFDWAAEMIGYNAACAHLNITTELVHDLQVRDIESDPTDRWDPMPSIHVGRAWFPLKDEALAAPWRDADDGGTNMGTRIQVWCKCNDTAAEQQPWPIPTTGMDFVSRHTLSILHNSIAQFGPVPVNESFRLPNNYYHPVI